MLKNKMDIQENYSLKEHNTFGIDVRAKYFAAFKSVEELKQLISYANEQSLSILILGEGSNILFTKNFDGLVLKNAIIGIEIVKQTDQHVYIKTGAGVIWHDLVLYTIEKQLSGIENLSLIPGTVGAAPIQNIGAYGIELKDTFECLEAVSIEDGNSMYFEYDTCQFGYRNSIFKNSLKGKLVITYVTLRLDITPKFNTSYGAIQETIKNMGIDMLSLSAISNAVISIRQSKLPDPKKIGNAGSFFKNPEITNTHFEELRKLNSTIPSYPALAGYTKIPAGWLIEQCGWKGKTFGQAGIHKNQALVLVNYGNATGLEISTISQKIQKSVLDKFGIQLEAEVNII
jgi:UDP-N-acetylmuramate dehydrogenase